MSDFKDKIDEVLSKLSEANTSAYDASNEAEEICTSGIESSIGDALSEIEEAREMLMGLEPPKSGLSRSDKDRIVDAVAKATIKAVSDALFSLGEEE